MAGITTPSITRIVRLSLITSDLAVAEAFFIEAFDCRVAESDARDPALGVLMGVPSTQVRQTILRLGEQEIALIAFDPPGRAYPGGSTSTDIWFQHFAIVVSDMDEAYAHLQRVGRYVPISEGGPQHLPPSSGSVSAFKFRDAEGHPLELLAFPKNGGPDVWEKKKRGTALFLGIDHSAISVADTRASIAFFEKAFGLKLAMQTENVGPEQSRMDAVLDARVTVSGLAPSEVPPHVELLDYKMGRRRPIDRGTLSTDVAATQFVLETADLTVVVEALTAQNARFVSPGVVTLKDGSDAVMVLDPDGHRFVVTQPPSHKAKALPRS